MSCRYSVHFLRHSVVVVDRITVLWTTYREVCGNGICLKPESNDDDAGRTRRWRCWPTFVTLEISFAFSLQRPATTTSTTPEASRRRRRRMLPIAGSIFPARRLWLKTVARCESSSSQLTGLARRTTHTESWSGTYGPKPRLRREKGERRKKRRILSESSRRVLEAGLDNQDVTPEHVEAVRNLSTVFSSTDPNKLTLRPDGFVPVSRVVRRLRPLYRLSSLNPCHRSCNTPCCPI